LAELAISELDTLLCSTSVVGGVDGLNADHYGVVVLFQGCQVFRFVLIGLDHAHFLRETLLEPRRKLVGIRARVRRVRVEIERDVGSVPALLSAEVDCDHALIVCIKFHVQIERLLSVFNQSYGFFLNVDMVLQNHYLLSLPLFSLIIVSIIVASGPLGCLIVLLVP